MNQPEADKLAANLRAWADLVEQSAVPALDVAHGWRGAMKGANYDPSGRAGHRHDEYEENGTTVVVAVPHDPTGESAFNPPDRMRHARLVAALGALSQAGLTFERLCRATIPVPQERKEQDEGPGEGWCDSCWRIHWLSPEHQHADGRVKHKGLCSWCAAFKASERCLPPESLLRKRAAGKKITERDVASALGRKRAS